MIESIFILIAIVLPGWLSVTASRLYHPHEIDKSAIMQWGMLVYHAVILHMIITLIPAIAVYVSSYFVAVPLLFDRALIDGSLVSPADSSMAFDVVAIALGTAYILVMTFGAIVLGITDFPSQITRYIGSEMRERGAAKEELPRDPLWYVAWRLKREMEEHPNVQLLVRMKNSDVYIGLLYEYQFAPHPDGSRDIILAGDIILWPGGDASNEIDLSFDERGGGGVMLNSANISSIEYLYHGDDEEDEEVGTNE